ncbi:MAG: ABC-2 type transport system permease protein [Spirosomataceae bacterium]|jgi:ABC-2 type transport system permease protein
MRNIIAKKEYTTLLRDKRFKLMGGFISVLLLLALIGGFVAFQSLKKERMAAQVEARETWLNQGEKNPHSAAHFGSFAFRPKSELSFFDFGVDSYVGTSVYLEAHRQNDAKFSAAQDSSSLIRFGEMTVSFVLQLLVPLLIIFLCFNAIVKEKEDNTLKLMLSQGVSLKQIAWGKIWGYSKALAWIILPALFIAFGLMTLGTDGTFTVDTVLRFTLMTFIYCAYFFLFIAASVLVSAYAKTSRNSLLQLLGIWIVACIILPKATANVGASLFKAPSNYEFREAIKVDEENGIDGHDPSDVRFDELKKQTLAKYNVETVEELPVNFDAIRMQAGEQYSTTVYNKHFDKLEGIYKMQNSVSAYSAVINPFMGVRNLSMGLAGSDYKTALAFQKQAEQYRFQMVEMLNNNMRDNTKTGDWDTKAKESLYAELPDFKFDNPTISQVLTQNIVGVLALAFWITLLSILVNRTKNLRIA